MTNVKFTCGLAIGLCLFGWTSHPLANPTQRTWPKDPFHQNIPAPHIDLAEPEKETATQEAPLTLQGILEIENRYRAMINDTILREGDVMAAYRVQKIAASYVLLRHANGHIFRLEFDSQ